MLHDERVVTEAGEEEDAADEEVDETGVLRVQARGQESHSLIPRRCETQSNGAEPSFDEIDGSGSDEEDTEDEDDDKEDDCDWSCAACASRRTCSNAAATSYTFIVWSLSEHASRPSVNTHIAVYW